MILIDPYKFATDPSRANLSLFLTGNGTHGSSSIVDSSPNEYVPTATTNAVYDNTQVKWPGQYNTSMKLTGGAEADALTYYTNRAALLLPGMFHMRGWYRFESALFSKFFAVFRGQLADAAGRFHFHTNATANAGVEHNYFGQPVRGYGDLNLYTAIDTWFWIEFWRDGANLITCKVNGTTIGTATESGTLSNNGGGIAFLRKPQNVWMQDFQLYKGVNLTPAVPTGPLPAS